MKLQFWKKTPTIEQKILEELQYYCTGKADVAVIELVKRGLYYPKDRHYA